MIGRTRIAWALIAALFAAGSSGAQTAPRRDAMVVLVSIDGLRPDYVLEADAHGARVPHLKQLMAQGAYATGVRGVVPTLTYPSHTTLVTGAAPARHGIYANTTFDPLGKNEGGWYWYASDIRVPTLWDVADAAGLIVADVHWPVTVDARISLNLPQYWRTGTPDDRKLLRALSTPGLLDSLEGKLGPYADGIDESIAGDENRARFAEYLLESERPNLFLAYFTALDHEEHAMGPFSPSSLAVLERIDRFVGRLRDAADRTSEGKATFVVVSDHGFVRTEREVNFGTAFRQAGLLATGDDGKVSTWRAMPWPAGASTAIVLRDSSDVAAARDTRALLARLAADSASGIDRVIEADKLHAAGGFPPAAFYVSLRPGFVIGNHLDGPLVRAATVRGMHGYSPELREMRASFFIAGPGVPAGRSLGDIDMRAIAPTIAAALGPAHD